MTGILDRWIQLAELAKLFGLSEVSTLGYDTKFEYRV